MDWQNILQSLVTAALGSGAAFHLMKYRDDKRKDDSHVKFLATQVAVLLEGYVIDAADKISDHVTAKDSDGAAGRILSQVPQLGPMPVSDFYQLFDRQLLDELLQFPQEREMSQRAAYFWIDVVGDVDCCNQAMHDETIRMAVKACTLARRIREKYELPTRKLVVGNWNIPKFLAEESAKIERRQRKTAEQELDAQEGIDSSRAPSDL